MTRFALSLSFISVTAFGQYAVTVIPAPISNITYASGINNAGQVVLSGTDSGGNYRVFIGTTSGSTPVPLPPGWNAPYPYYGYSINASGQVAGTGNSNTGSDQAFIGTPSGSTAIPFPSGLPAYGFGRSAVNDSGQVASAALNGSSYLAFIGTAAGSVAIPLPAGWTGSAAFGINSSGQVAGTLNPTTSTFQPFIGSTSGSTAIPLPMGWSAAGASSINDSGQITGYGTNASGQQQAFAGSVTGITPIPLPIGATSAYVSQGSINNSGVVVGQSDVGGWIWDAADGARLLRTLAPAGWVVGGAISIANNGLILGWAQFNGGPTQYVVLSPFPCTISINPITASAGPAASSGSFTVTTGAGCAWTAVSNNSFLSISSGAAGSGNGIVIYNVAANTGVQPLTGTITIAGPLGNLTFTVNQSVSPPAAPTLISPANGATGVSFNPTLTWNAASGAVSYNVFLGTSPPPSPSRSVTQTSYSPLTLLAGTTYYWQIVSMNPGGSAASPVWSFTTSTLEPASVSPASGSGLTQTFTFTFNDPNGFSDLSVLDVLINDYLDGQTACYFALAPVSASSGYLYLVDDAGDGLYVNGTPMLLPSSGSLTNSQCTLNGTGSSISANGNTLTLTMSIAFKAAFAGNRIFYMAARSNSQNSGWQARGTWNVPGSPLVGPAVGAMSPGRSTTTGQTYSFTFTDSNGYADLNVLDILVNSFLDGDFGCYVAYVPTGPTTGYVYLRDDANFNYVSGSPMLLSSGGTLQNDQCTVSAAGSSASANANILTLNLAITFNAGFAGNQVFYLAARNSGAGNSGWQAVGSVTVP